VLIRITRDPLDPKPFVQHVRRDESGAVALFLGVARNNNLGRRVLRLEYDAYPEMAERKLRQVAEEMASRWPITDIAIAHRIGRLEIGETSLVVAVSSPHRKEAFDACQQTVDRIKEVVPIWKKEVWEGGATWIEGEKQKKASSQPE
jgi:molybdopterin synthase catalytic subunit